MVATAAAPAPSKSAPIVEKEKTRKTAKSNDIEAKRETGQVDSHGNDHDRAHNDDDDDDDVFYGAPDDVVWSDKSHAQRAAVEAANLEGDYHVRINKI